MRLKLLYVVTSVSTQSMVTDRSSAAFWHSHVDWVLLVFRVHHCHRPRRVHQSRSELGHWIQIWPANGAGKLKFPRPFSLRRLTVAIRSISTP